MRVCVYCGQNATTKDHIIPLSRGGDRHGSRTYPNIHSACEKCNQSKSNLTHEEYLAVLERPELGKQLRKAATANMDEWKIRGKGKDGRRKSRESRWDYPILYPGAVLLNLTELF